MADDRTPEEIAEAEKILDEYEKALEERDKNFAKLSPEEQKKILAARQTFYERQLAEEHFSKDGGSKVFRP